MGDSQNSDPRTTNDGRPAKECRWPNNCFHPACSCIQTTGTILARLQLWFIDKDERRAFGGGFRPPWSRYMSVRMAKEVGILQ